MNRFRALMLSIGAIVITVSCIALALIQRNTGIELKSMNEETFRWFVCLSSGVGIVILGLMWKIDGDK